MTSRMYFKTLAILHSGLLIGQVFFAGIIFLVHSMGRNNVFIPGPRDLYFYIAFALVFATALASYYLYQSKVGEAREKVTLLLILNDYRSAMLMRDAILEGSSMLATIAFFLTGNERYLALTGLVVLIYLIWWPTQAKVINDLALEGEFRNKLGEPDAVIE